MATTAQRLVTEDALAKTRFINGSGTPNNQVSAAPGSVYVDAAKTWDVAAWIKTAGNGSTGWEPALTNAKARSLMALSSTPVAAGDIRYTRTVSGITLAIDGLKPTTDGALILFADKALEAIAPTPGMQAEFRVGVANTETTRRAKLDQNGVLTVYGAKAADVLYGSVHYNTSRVWSEPLGAVV